jgi:hypothetical protein
MTKKNILLSDSSRGDIIAFHNQVFVPLAKVSIYSQDKVGMMA